MLSSILAFNRQRGFDGFSRDAVGTDNEYVRQVLASGLSALATWWKQRQGEAQLLRFEDLILDPRCTLEAVFRVR